MGAFWGLVMLEIEAIIGILGSFLLLLNCGMELPPLWPWSRCFLDGLVFGVLGVQGIKSLAETFLEDCVRLVGLQQSRTNSARHCVDLLISGLDSFDIGSSDVPGCRLCEILRCSTAGTTE